MKNLKFYWLDVFAEKPLEGNQLAVFPDAGALGADEMQAVAREMNLSESTFVTGTRKDASGRMVFETRIFTVEEELPFAGHPTLGTSYLMRSLHGLDHVVLGLKVGEIPVSFSEQNGHVYGEMRQVEPKFGAIHERERIAEIFGVGPEDLDSGYPIQTVSTGVPFIMVPFRELKVLENISPDFRKMQPYLEGSDGKFFYAVCRETMDKGSILHARMIFYGGEDPATGSAAGPAAAWMLKYGIMEPETINWIEQGLEMERPCRIYVMGSMNNGVPGNIRVGGHCSILGKGEIGIP